ncbi:hypothetical protein QBC32DRAFT_316737, partial [Pseudoneurospora amorphoporcata]
MSTMVLMALLTIVSFMGFTTGIAINRDLSGFKPLNVSIGGSINPIGSTSSSPNISLGGAVNPVGSPFNSLPSSGPSQPSGISRRSYRKSAP